MPKLSIIMPVFNEIATIEQAVIRVMDLPIDKELIIFDDYSTDGCRELLIELNKKYNFKLLLHEKNLGKGRGVIEASKYATGEYFIVEDSDLELNPSDIVKMLKIIEEDPSIDLVNGDRKITSSAKVNLVSLIANFVTRVLIFILYGKFLKDILSSYKLSKLSKFKELGIQADRFGFESEWILRSLKNNYKIQEIDIEYSPRTAKAGKKINILDGFEIIWTIIKLRFAK